MSAALKKSWTRDEFFPWAEAENERYEFDGFQPVAMTGGTAVHSMLTRNLVSAIDRRLSAGPCQVLGPDAGVAVGEAVRYPDALITCAAFPNEALTIPGVLVVFEVISPSSERVDRIVKVREYPRVATIRRYVIVESTSVGLTVLSRTEAGQDWTVRTRTEGEALELPEVGIVVPLAEIYARVEFPSRALP